MLSRNSRGSTEKYAVEPVGTSDFQSVTKCTVLHPGFQAICLNKWVWKQHRFSINNSTKNHLRGQSIRKNRHIAYRQLARWCWGFLGRQVRVVLPSCAVNCITANFPPPGNEDDFVSDDFSDPGLKFFYFCVCVF